MKRPKAIETSTKVFISSTSKDLASHREEVDKTLRQLGFTTIKMEDFAAMGSRAVEACISKVDQADIYIGIFAYRYGFIPEGSDISITEIEFNRARANGIECLCFMVDENTPWLVSHIEDEPGRTKLQALKTRISRDVVWAAFSTPTDLALQVTKALYNLRPIPTATGVNVYPDHLEAHQFLHTYIANSGVKKSQAILFSGSTSLRTLIESLLKKGTQVDLLIQHPDSCEFRLKRSDILNTLTSILYSVPNVADISGLNVQLYRDRASFRGIALDNNVLAISWYSYHSKSEEIQGHRHPQFVIKAPSKAYDDCKRMFDYIFKSLSNNSESLSEFLKNNPNLS